MFKLQVLIIPESYYLEKYSDSGETNSIGGTNPDSTDTSTVATTTTNNNVFRYSTPDAAINNSMIFARPGSFNANSSFMFPPSYIQSQPYIQPASANKIKKFLHITSASNTLDAVAQEINLRFQRLYPSEEPLNILKIQNFEECDLDPDYAVSMVFDTSNICRVIVSNEFNDTPNANGKRFLNQDLNRVMKKRRLTNTNVGNTSIWNTTIDDNEFHMADHPGDRNKHLNKPLGMRVDSEPDVSSAIPGPEDTVIHPSKSPHLKIASPIIATGSPTRITSGMLNIQSQPDLSKVDYEEDTNGSIYIEQDPKRASVPSKEDRNNEKHNTSPFLSRLNNPDSSMIHESDISSSSIKSPTSQRSALQMPNQPPLEIVIPKEASAAAVVKGSKKQKITKDGSSSKKAVSAKDDKASLDTEKEDKENDKAEKLALKVKEKAEKEKAVAEKAERLAKEKAEKAEKLAKERAEKAEKLAKEKAEKAERLAKEKAEKAEKLAKEKAEKAEKLAREKAEKAEKLAKEKAEKAEKLAKEKAEKEKLAKEIAEKEKIAKEKSDAAKLLKEKAEREKAAKQKDDEDDLAKEKAAKEKASKEKGAKERLEKEKAENAERERMKAIADDDAAAHRAKEHAAKMAQAIAERLSKSNTEKKANQEKSKGSEKSSVTEVPKNALKKSKTATKDLKVPESDIENEDDLKTIENLTREDTPDDEKLQNLAKPTKVKKLVVTPNQSTTVTESRETVFSKPAVLSQLSQKKISKVDNKAARAVEISGEIDESNILPPKPRGATILKEILTSDSSDSEVNSDDSSDDTSDDDQKSKPKVVTAPSNSKPRVVSQNNLSHSKEVILEPAKNIPLNPVTKPGPLVILSKSESSEPLSKRSTLPRLSAFIDKKLPEVRMQKQSQKSTAKPEVASDSDSDSDSESNSDSEGDSDSTSDSESASESDADVNASKFINSKTATQFVTTKKSKSKGKKNSGFSALMKDSKK